MSATPRLLACETAGIRSNNFRGRTPCSLFPESLGKRHSFVRPTREGSSPFASVRSHARFPPCQQLLPRSQRPSPAHFRPHFPETHQLNAHPRLLPPIADNKQNRTDAVSMATAPTTRSHLPMPEASKPTELLTLHQTVHQQRDKRFPALTVQERNKSTVKSPPPSPAHHCQCRFL